MINLKKKIIAKKRARYLKFVWNYSSDIYVKMSANVFLFLNKTHK